LGKETLNAYHKVTQRLERLVYAFCTVQYIVITTAVKILALPSGIGIFKVYHLKLNKLIFGSVII